MTATATTGFDFDTMTADEAYELRYADSADSSEVAGEHGIYLDDQLQHPKHPGRLAVLWTFKGSVLLRHSDGRYLITTNDRVAAAGWKA